MTLVVTRATDPGMTPVHILIVLVGKYETNHTDLKGTEALTRDVVDMWTKGAVELPDNQMLATVEVLASDPDRDAKSELVQVEGSHGETDIDLPSLDNVKAALNAWGARIANTQGVGVLHWTGHGHSRSINGIQDISLLCNGVMKDTHGNVIAQEGLDWDLTKQRIDGLARGRPVYCFIDVCRTVGNLSYDGFGVRAGIFNSLQVFYSCANDQSSFWVEPGSMTPVPIAFEGHSIGMRAFMAALQGFGAKIEDALAPRHAVVSHSIIVSSKALAKMWLECLGLSRKMEAQFVGDDHDACISMTSKPMSVVSAASTITRKTSCDAFYIREQKVLSSQSPKSPFMFALDCAPYKFRTGKAPWSREFHIVFPTAKIAF
jgi:hypothetical protein